MAYPVITENGVNWKASIITNITILNFTKNSDSANYFLLFFMIFHTDQISTTHLHSPYKWTISSCTTFKRRLWCWNFTKLLERNTKPWLVARSDSMSFLIKVMEDTMERYTCWVKIMFTVLLSGHCTMLAQIIEI